jgi:single-strand DNA-binding protein
VHVGQPVVVTGTLTVRDWESGERTGSDADLVVRTIGHDLRWGRASFVKPERARPVEAAPGSGPEAVGERAVPSSDREVPVGELRHESAA